jgi:hypothetical protein
MIQNTKGPRSLKSVFHRTCISSPTPLDRAFLQALDRGGILECQDRRYNVGGRAMARCQAKRFLERGWADAPPDLFNPLGGRITSAGRGEARWTRGGGHV